MIVMSKKKKKRVKQKHAHPGNRTPVSTVGGYYDTTTLDALLPSLISLLILISIDSHTNPPVDLNPTHRILSRKLEKNQNKI
jgi:hypothetical protein